MSEQQAPATGSETRTLIQDLAPAVEDLTADEAEQTEGGMISRGVNLGGTGPLNCCDHYPTQYPNSCTAGNALTGPDTDYGTDSM